MVGLHFVMGLLAASTARPGSKEAALFLTQALPVDGAVFENLLGFGLCDHLLLSSSARTNDTPEGASLVLLPSWLRLRAR